jgi:UDP-N-acetylglucosamine--N-acetylmuramyl-(pentapeptide) pyrophosphoryl-undecaprenol N-acetylglucosamine transferase
LATAGIQVLHAVGPRNAGSVVVRRDAGPDPQPAAAYVVVPYLDRMDLAYAAADLALCRAGAITCAELAAVGLPAVYVPLPIGNGEQRFNARPVVGAGGGLLAEDAELSAEWLRDHLVPLLTDPVRLGAMGEAAARFGRRDADRTLVRMVHEAAAGDRPSR